MGGRRQRPGRGTARRTTERASVDEIKALAEDARLRLLGTPWGADGRVTPEGRDLLLELARSGAILAPLAKGRADEPGAGEPPPRDEAVGLAAVFAAGLLATRGEAVPRPMAKIVEDTLRQIRNRRERGCAR